MRVHHGDGLIECLGAHHRKHRPENFLLKKFDARLHAVEERGANKEAAIGAHGASVKSHLGSEGWCVIDIADHSLLGGAVDHWSHVGAVVGGGVIDLEG